MLFKVGLLPKEKREEADAAFKSYSVAETKEDWEHSRAFQMTRGSIKTVPIEFLGCWSVPYFAWLFIGGVETIHGKGTPLIP